jgi:hypothetical protein
MTRRVERPGVREGYDRWASTCDATPNPDVALDRRVARRNAPRAALVRSTWPIFEVPPLVGCEPAQDDVGHRVRRLLRG